MFKVETASREKLHGAIALVGPSGSGKTVSGLRIAHGIVKTKYPDKDDAFIWSKIGVADTEHKRSKIYADMTFDDFKIGKFKHINFEAPFSPSRYKGAVEALKKEGCEVILIDSISHAWEGMGGLLDMQQEAGGTFQAWKKIKPDIQDFIRTLTQSDVHIIATIRTKQDFAVETTELGKTQIKKVGLKPIQKDDLEYEFQIVFSVDMEHHATPSKDNSNMFDGKTFKITEEVGEKIYQWLEEGIDVKAIEKQQMVGMVAKIRGLQEVNKNDELDKMIAELETKAKKKIEELPMALLERATQLVEFKIHEIGGITNVIQDKQKQSKGK